MIQCARCAAANQPSSKYCLTCGAPLPAASAVPTGAPVARPAPAAPPPAGPPPAWGPPGYGPPPDASGGYAPQPNYPQPGGGYPQGPGAANPYGPTPAAPLPASPYGPPPAPVFAPPPGTYAPPPQAAPQPVPVQNYPAHPTAEPSPFAPTAPPANAGDARSGGYGPAPGAGYGPAPGGGYGPAPGQPPPGHGSAPNYPAASPYAAPLPAPQLHEPSMQRGPSRPPSTVSGRDPDSIEANAPRALAGFLVSYDGLELGAYWPIYQGQNVLGRRGAAPGLDVEIDHPTTSSRHAVLYASARPARLKIEDTGSTNGTFLGEQQLERGRRTEVKDGDSIRFGGFATIVKLV